MGMLCGFQRRRELADGQTQFVRFVYMIRRGIVMTGNHHIPIPADSGDGAPVLVGIESDFLAILDHGIELGIAHGVLAGVVDFQFFEIDELPLAGGVIHQGHQLDERIFLERLEQGERIRVSDLATHMQEVAGPQHVLRAPRGWHWRIPSKYDPARHPELCLRPLLHQALW